MFSNLGMAANVGVHESIENLTALPVSLAVLDGGMCSESADVKDVTCVGQSVCTRVCAALVNLQSDMYVPLLHAQGSR